MCAAQVHMPPPVGTPVPPFAPLFVGVTLGFLGLPSVLQGLCALAGFLCRATLGSPSRHLFGPQSMSCSRAEKCSFPCLLPSKSLLCLVFQDGTVPL